MKRRLEPSTSLIDLDNLRLISHWKDGTSPCELCKIPWCNLR
jgi:hypothetical protein